MTEILDYANSIATSKENIRQALVARGVTCGSEVPLDDYANKINNMVVSGSVDNVLAYNFTGAAVTTGDKVYIKQNATISQSMATIYNTSGVYTLLSASGKTGYIKYSSNNMYAYFVPYATTMQYSSDATSTFYNYEKQQVRYDDYGNITQAGILIQDNRMLINLSMCQDDYAFDFSAPDSTTSSLNFYKIDPTDNFAIKKTWTLGGFGGSYYPKGFIMTVIGNKLYVAARTGSTWQKVGTIDDESATITLEDEGSSNIVLHSTKDNALAIVATSTDGYPCCWTGLKLFNINNDYSLGTQFVSANADLNNLLAMSNVFVIFNRNTGILCLSTQASDSNYGVFKYENGDFTTVNITLDSFTAETYQMMFMSQDMSMLLIGRYLYTLAQTADGNYKAIPYSSYDLGSDVLTGVALNDAAVGASFNVKTILP
ncbi:MAG: hypothetical protein J6039_03020 [Alphaproteobacteria bacterium]|nr:hypothetical protein [Alphaproteobacteria bacterium]